MHGARCRTAGEPLAGHGRRGAKNKKLLGYAVEPSPFLARPCHSGGAINLSRRASRSDLQLRSPKLRADRPGACTMCYTLLRSMRARTLCYMHG